jgi:peptide/nickel transport system permease protein
LGTDSIGRDTLSRLIYGSRLSLAVGFAAMLLGALLGTLVGVISGFFGGIIEAISGWLIDVQLSFPFLLLAIFLLGAMGGGKVAVICVLALATWVNYARIVRSQVLSIRNQGYVEAARAAGAGASRLIFIHILPNTLGPLFVVASFSMAQAILTEASLSFTGLGLDPSTPSWGTMLNDGRDYLLSAWWISTMPGIAIGFTVFGVLMLGEGLREVLDPRGSR